MNINIIKQTILNAIEKCERIECTNSVTDGIIDLGENLHLPTQYASLASILADAVNFINKDIDELSKAKELNQFSTANVLKSKSNAVAITEEQFIEKFGMSTVQIAELHIKELMPYETIQNN